MHILTNFRTRLRQYPLLKACLIPIYLRMLPLRWKVRNLLTRRSPIMFDVGQYHLKMYPDGMIPEVLYNGHFEIDERDFVAAFLKPGMTVVDAGANVGLYSITASGLVGTSGIVHAFEPGRLTFERLQRNLILNQCQNVVATRAALSNTQGRMVLRIDPAHPTFDGHCFVQPYLDVMHLTSTDEIVNCQTLDDYFSTFKAIDFMKIDEGAELELLQGAEKILSSSLSERQALLQQE